MKKDRRYLVFMLCIYIRTFYHTTDGAKVKNGDVAVTEGEDATMSCRITETDEIISQVTWQKRTRGNSVREDFLVIVAPQDVHHVNGLGERVRFIGDIAAQNGSIRVLNVSLRDEGNYTCIITVFPSGSFQTEIKLSVRVRPKVTITPEAPPVVGEGEQIMAACTAASGRPPASVTWVVDHLNSTFRIHSNETHHSDGTTTVRSYLIVVPTISMNEQEVQCVVNHTALKQEEAIPFRIQVHYPPHSVNIRHGTSREGPVFQCMADSSPSEGTKYTWSRVNGTMSSASVENGGSRLMLSAASADLSGLYLCEASNQFGRASASLFVYIGDTPRGIYGVFIALIVVLLAVLIFFIWKMKYSQQRESRPLTKPQERELSSVRKSSIEEAAQDLSTEQGE